MTRLRVELTWSAVSPHGLDGNYFGWFQGWRLAKHSAAPTALQKVCILLGEDGGSKSPPPDTWMPKRDPWEDGHRTQTHISQGGAK